MKLKQIETAENFFQKLLIITGCSICVLLIAIFITLLIKSHLAIKTLGFSFIFGSSWDPIFQHFGAFPFVLGTILTSFLALLISLPFSLALSLLLGEYFQTGIFSSIIKSAIELLAGIPSVIYGLWAIFFLVPLVRSFELMAGIMPYGVGIFSAALILAIMIIPYSTSLAREIIQAVPNDLKEAGMALGATRFEVIKKIVLPYASSGIFAGILLSLGRALGETMAVTMVIGNNNNYPESIFAPGNTLASVIANEFAEATFALHISSLVALGLYLFIITAIINFFGRLIIRKFSIEKNI
jgi:phosphate transport system permease protein